MIRYAGQDLDLDPGPGQDRGHILREAQGVDRPRGLHILPTIRGAEAGNQGFLLA